MDLQNFYKSASFLSKSRKITFGASRFKHYQKKRDLIREKIVLFYKQDVQNALKQNIFIAEYGVTPINEIRQAYEDEKVILVRDGMDTY